VDQLRHIRAERGLTLRDLAQASGVSKDTISEIERGVRKPHPTTVGKLAKALEVEVADLYPKVTAPVSSDWALSAPDDSFRRSVEEASTESLRSLVLELVGGEQPRLFENLHGEHHPPEELYRRSVAFARALIVREELLRRGDKPPERHLLAFKRYVDALDLSENPAQRVMTTPSPKSPGSASAAEEPRLGYLRSWRAFVWKLIHRWEQDPPKTNREIAVVLDTMQALIEEGAFEHPPEEITTSDRREASEWFDLQFLFRGIRRLNEIADSVEEGKTAEERRSLLRVIQGELSEGELSA
jgi:transcriptional regulator with XRE-family HTH domain